MAQKRLLLRFDVAPAIGAGHMMRCLALADRLARDGYAPTVAINADGAQLLPPAMAGGAILLPTADRGSGVRTISAAGADFDLMVCDHYKLAAADERELRRNCGTLVVIDDVADRAHDCDLLIDSAPGQDSARYDGLIGAALPLLGIDYALLRGEFLARRLADPRPAHAGGSRVLISMGATDPDNVSSAVVDAIDGLAGIGSITVVLGTGAPYVARISERLRTTRTPTRLLTGVSAMAELIGEHDIGIGAPGTTALERACLGLPQALIETAANQRLVAAGMEQNGAARAFGPATDVDWHALRTALAAWSASPETRQRMRISGQRLVDGRGVDRVAAHIFARPRTRDGQPLRMRRLAMTDSQAILSWQLDVSTRRYFRNPAPPPRAAHEDFMRARCSDPTAISEIATLDDAPVALVRADPRARGYEVAIVVAPQMRGRGIGAAALTYLDALLYGQPLAACVDRRNTASLALFEAAGYGKTGDRVLDVVDLSNTPGVSEIRP